MAHIPTVDEARRLLGRYNQEAFHLRHGETVSAVLGWFAGQHDPENVAFWQAVGMLHDIDFEQWPEAHCVKGIDLLREAGVDEGLIRSAMSHGWGQTGAPWAPESLMEKILFTVDELTGLIGAAALMRPSKSVGDMEVSSLKKKFKDKKFAAGCSRDTIRQGADLLGWDLDALFALTLEAMRATEKPDS